MRDEERPSVTYRQDSDGPLQAQLWLERARPGDSLVYHRGYLDAACRTDARLASVRAVLRQAAGKGVVRLVRARGEEDPKGWAVARAIRV